MLFFSLFCKITKKFALFSARQRKTFILLLFFCLFVLRKGKVCYLCKSIDEDSDESEDHDEDHDHDEDGDEAFLFRRFADVPHDRTR